MIEDLLKGSITLKQSCLNNYLKDYSGKVKHPPLRTHTQPQYLIVGRIPNELC